jgi:hypothetical protein
MDPMAQFGYFRTTCRPTAVTVAGKAVAVGAVPELDSLELVLLFGLVFLDDALMGRAVVEGVAVGASSSTGAGSLCAVISSVRTMARVRPRFPTTGRSFMAAIIRR